ncbi:outer membrane beta-barrel protein [Dyadobacter jiangsuensis]
MCSQNLWLFGGSFTNRFQYTELVNAAYVSTSRKLGPKMQVQLGLAARHTHSTDRSLSRGQRVVRQNECKQQSGA